MNTFLLWVTRSISNSFIILTLSLRLNLDISFASVVDSDYRDSWSRIDLTGIMVVRSWTSAYSYCRICNSFRKHNLQGPRALSVAERFFSDLAFSEGCAQLQMVSTLCEWEASRDGRNYMQKKPIIFDHIH